MGVTGWGWRPAGRAAAVAIVSATCTPAAVAQTAPVLTEELLLPLGTIEVEGQREDATGPVDGYVANVGATGTKTDTPLIGTPQSISVITADQLEARGVTEAGEVLRYTAGATGEPYGTDSRGIYFQLRGFNVDDDAFYRDGLRQRGSATASFMSLDPYGAERFEVLRGPASVLYGQISPGGLLNYVSKRPTEEAFREVELEVGSFKRLGASFDVSGPANADGTLLYRLTGHGHFTDTHVDFVDQERAFIAPAVTWRPDEDTSLTVLANVQHDRSGWDIQFLPASGTVLPNPNGTIPRDRFAGEPDFNKIEQTQESIGYLFEHRFGEAFTFRQNARFQHLYNTQKGVFAFGLQADGRTYDRYGDHGESSVHGVVADTQVQAEFTTGPVDHTFLFGVDVQYNKYSDLGVEYAVDPIDIFNPIYGSPVGPVVGAYQDSDTKLGQTGLYAQDQLKIGRFTLVAGGRHDWSKIATVDTALGTDSSQEDSAFSERVGAIYEFEAGFAPYASYATSFNPIVGTDRSGKPFEPETGEQYEVGLKYQPPGWNAFITLAAFSLTQQNVLTTDPADDRFQKQAGEIRSRGIEIEGVASLDFGLDLIASYALIGAEITKSNDGLEGNIPYGIPLHRASVWADYTIPHGRFAGLGAGIGVRYVGETWGDDDNTFKVPDYALVDAAFHYERGKFKVGVTASNLLDKTYVASCFYAATGCFYGEGIKVIGTIAYRW